MTNRTRRFCSSVALAVVGVLATHGALGAAIVKFDVPAQPLAESIKTLASQAKTNVMFDEPLVEGRRSEALQMDGTVDQALTSLLANTGLTYQFVNEETVVLTGGSSKRLLGLRSDTNATAEEVASNTSEPPDPYSELSINADNGGGSDESSSRPTLIDEVVVTGTHIRGTSPASPVITILRDAIARTGSATTSDFMRFIPQNFNGGQNPGVFGADGVNNFNLTGAATPNLRGLGSQSTLTLVNGHRLAVNGVNSGSDVSIIPLAAVERVEVLTDGASAVYGSDAIAGVINFQLRKNFNGAQTRASYGNSTSGGGLQRQFGQLLGASWQSGSVLIDGEYSETAPLYSSEREFSQSLDDPNWLIPRQTRKSFFLSSHQNVNDSTAVFLEGLFTEREQRQLIADTGYTQQVRVPVKQHSGTAGLEKKIHERWTITALGTVAEDNSNQRSAYQIFGVDYAIANGFINKLKLAEAQISGPVFDLSSGPASLAMGGGYRNERYEATVDDEVDHEGDRRLHYLFSELHLPLNGFPGLTKLDRRLELSIAARYEKYSDFGSTTNPKVGLLFQPTKSLLLRATWGTSFHAPSFEQSSGTKFLYLFGLLDPTPTGQTQLLMTFGGNGSLKPEKSNSWTLNLEYKSPHRQGLKFSATPYIIRYRDMIVAPISDPLVAINSPDIYAPFVVNNPNEALQTQLIQDYSSGGFTNRSGEEYSSVLVAYALYGQYQNASRRLAKGLDLSLEYPRQLRIGNMQAFISASYLHLNDRFTAQSPEAKIAGTIFNPPGIRARGGITWNRGAWNATGSVNFSGREENTASATQNWVSSWTTFDAQLGYSGQRPSFLGGLNVRLSALNLLDRKPPSIASDSTISFVGVGFDSTNASPLGRFLSIAIDKTWGGN